MPYLFILVLRYFTSYNHRRTTKRQAVELFQNNNTLIIGHNFKNVCRPLRQDNALLNREASPLYRWSHVRLDCIQPNKKICFLVKMLNHNESNSRPAVVRCYTYSFSVCSLLHTSVFLSYLDILFGHIFDPTTS